MDSNLYIYGYCSPLSVIPKMFLVHSYFTFKERSRWASSWIIRRPLSIRSRRRFFLFFLRERETRVIFEFSHFQMVLISEVHAHFSIPYSCIQLSVPENIFFHHPCKIYGGRWYISVDEIYSTSFMHTHTSPLLNHRFSHGVYNTSVGDKQEK